MIDKLELKSSHEVVNTVYVADVESIFYCKPDDPDILTVLMKDGKRLYCDEVCPIDSLQEDPSIPEIVDEHYWEMLGEEPVSKVWHDVSKEVPTNFGCPILVACRNKNKDCGIWLYDLIQDWEGEWEPRVNWETPVKWAYVKDLGIKECIV